jgi:hypothetical protein
MSTKSVGHALLLTAGILSIAHADDHREGKVELRLLERLEMKPPSAFVTVNDGETISHVLYAIKLKIGSRVPLYGAGGLVERYSKNAVFSGSTIEVPLGIFERSIAENERPTENRAPAQSSALTPNDNENQPVLRKTPSAEPLPPAMAPALEQSPHPSQKFPNWEVGVGFGYTAIEGEDRSNATRARLISKMAQRLSFARYFHFGPDLEVGAHYQLSRVDFDSESLSIQLRRNFDLLSAFGMSLEKKWGRTALKFTVGAEDSLFYYSRSNSDITIDTRGTTFGELRLVNQVFEYGGGGLFIEGFGKSYSSSSGSNYSSEQGYGYGFSLRVKEFESGSACGLEYGLRRQATNYLYLTQPTFDLNCAVRF